MKKESFVRDYDRKNDEKRPVEIITNYLETNPYSVMIKIGKTKVICAASTGNRFPPHLKDTDRGWITAEYSMIPPAPVERSSRERYGVKGRTKEIERLIGRSLRAICDLRAISSESIIVDCDVIQADGGTRTASITGGFVALYLLIKNLQGRKRISRSPITDFLAAVSVGIVHGEALLDLNSCEDMAAQVDMNFVMTDSGRMAEIQATGEEATFNTSQLQEMISLGEKGARELIREQKKVLGLLR
jgi:ribonuclease PH